MEICALPLILLFDIYEVNPNTPNLGLWFAFGFVTLLIIAVRNGTFLRNSLISIFTSATPLVQSSLKHITNACITIFNATKSLCTIINANIGPKLSLLQKKIKNTLLFVFNLITNIFKK